MTAYSISTANALFKINYYKRSENMYNSANVTLGRIKKRYDFTGRSRSIATSLSFSGGVGSGTLPVSNVGNYQEASISAKKVYAICLVDRESIKASMDDKGAFIEATKESIQKTVESYTRNASRILFNDATGLLGKGDGTQQNVSGSGSAGSPFIVQIPQNQSGLTVGSWKEANWEERDFVQMVIGADATTGLGGAMETTLLAIAAVDPVNRLISLTGTSAALTALSGVGPLPATVGIAMQGSYLNDPQGFKNVLGATSGTLYGITVQRRWQAFQKSAAGAGLVVDYLNEVMLGVEKKFGKAPNLIECSYTQFRKLLNLLEDQKQYIIEPRSKDLKGKVSFKGIEFMSSMGPVGVFPERFVEDDIVWFLNDNHIECHHRPGFGWFDDDGTVFLREATSDSYSARYGGYYENYIEPTAHGVLYGLAV